MRPVPYARQAISDDDIAAVAEVLRSDWLTQGPAVPRFESALTKYCGASHAVAVNSGTSALHIACLALGLGPGDRLWTSANTFVASANCARYCGADVDFVDIDPGTFNLSTAALADKLARAEREARLPKIVVPVHFGGQPCDVAEIARLARRYGFAVVEDASHALGAEYRGAMVGSCDHSDITVLSFHPVKIITTGEGGAALTRRADLAERMRLLRSHGTTREETQMEGPSEGPWYYQQIALGWNYRMTDVQAVLGTSQLARADEFVARRRTLALRYVSLLEGLPLAVQQPCEGARSAYHLFVIRLNDGAWPGGRAGVFRKMRERNVLVNVHYIPVPAQPYYRKLGFRIGDYPRADSYYRGALSLPMFADLSDDDQEYVVASLRSILTSH